MLRGMKYLLLFALVAFPLAISADDAPPAPEAPNPNNPVAKPTKPVKPAKAVKAEKSTKAKAKKIAPVTTASGLVIEDVVVGAGAQAEKGRKVSVHYTGKLTSGKEFDSSKKRGPFDFVLGVGQVIRGWDEGVAGMKEGGKRKLTIPPGLGYGASGAGAVIPPNATLVFDVDLIKVH